jgi:RNA polymerase sigma-70 factor (ECF subfamily)
MIRADKPGDAIAGVSPSRPVERGRALSTAERRARIEALYASERPGLARHLFALTSDREAVDDLMNEVFVCAFEALPDFDGRSSVTTWLHGIAVNVARNHRAKRQRWRLFLTRLSAEPTTAAAETPEADVRAARAARRLYAALDRLSDPLREAFVVHVLENRTLKESAALLGLPVSTVHERAQRATSLVRASVEGEEEVSDGR